MKKLYSVIAVMLSLFVATSQAQGRWELSETSVAEIQAGEDFDYVLRQGVNTQWSSNGYLNTGSPKVVQEVDSTCIYHFLEYGEKVVGDQSYKVYVLKNEATGMYISDGDNSHPYVSNKAGAFKFTARHAKEKPDANWDDWNDFSCCVNVTKCIGAEAQGGWVFCDSQSSSRFYMGLGGNPWFTRYTDTSHWFVHLATEVEISAYDKLSIVYDKYLVEAIDTERYPVGNTPGCISQELYDEMNAVYEEASAAIMNMNMKPEEYEKVRLHILNVFDRYAKEMIPVRNGYYVIVNGRSQDAAYDGGDIARCKLKMEAPDAWTVENAKFIWEIIEAETPGRVFFRNFGTGKYLGKGDPLPMVADSTSGFETPHMIGKWFRIFDGTNFVHNNSSGKFVTWNSIGTANRWRFESVPVDTIDSLRSAVSQNLMTKKLAGLLKKANEDIAGLQNEAGLTYDDVYLPKAKGLIKEMSANSVYPSNKEKLAFDGRVDTYFHSMWQAAKAPQDDWHWVQFDMGKQLSEFVLKFTDRHDRPGNRPVKISFVAPENDDVEATAWTDTLFTGEVEATYATHFPNGTQDSTTFIGKITLKRPAKNLRMVVLQTVRNDIRGMGPTYNISELRLYDLAECVDNPSVKLIPQELFDNLNTICATAQAEIDANTATQATYDALEKAIDAIWEAYPDPSALVEMVEKAETMYGYAAEGSEMGYFQEGAKTEFKKVIDAVKGSVEGKTLTIAEIETEKQKLAVAMKAFNSKIIAPEEGHVYRIVNAAPLKEDGTEDKLNFSLICSVNADINDAPIWRYKDYETIDDRFNTLWKVEKSEAGIAFKNLANGYYLGNPYEGLTEEEIKDLNFKKIGYSATPKHFQLGAGVQPGTFNMEMTSGQYVNYEPSGNIVHWYNEYSNGCLLSFTEVTEEDFQPIYKIDAKAGQVQIMSLPIELALVYGNSSTAMKVLGVKNGKVQLAEYAEGENIPAGTPFIIATDAANEVEGIVAEEFVIADLVGQNLASNLDLTYKHGAVVQNGLVSSPVEFVIEPGFGYIYGQKVLLTEGGEKVYAGTGFFNNQLPQTEEEGTMQLDMEGTINGEGTAVDKIQLVKNVNVDVYTLSGVKVRSNVKTAVATQGLPKGVYIVGGQKVIVK